MQLKLTRDQLIGSSVVAEGQVVNAEGKYAETLVRSGAAVPVTPPIETATPEPRAERATSPRQR